MPLASVNHMDANALRSSIHLKCCLSSAVVGIYTTALLIQKVRSKYVEHEHEARTLIIKANEMHYFSNLFDKVLYCR